MAAKVVFLDRVLTGYGPETAEARAVLRNAIEQLAHRAIKPTRTNTRPNPGLNTQAGNALYPAIQQLTPHNETQRNLKAQATTLAVELGQVRTMLVADSRSSISQPLLIVVGYRLWS